MHLKEPNNYFDLRFQMESPKGGSFWVPKEGKVQTIQDLFGLVLSVIDDFDEKGFDYSRVVRREAMRSGMSFEQYMLKIIQHQICIRNPNDCYEDGFSDKLHFRIAKSLDDKIDKLPSSLRSAARLMVKGATKAATGRSKPRLSGCRTCGGKTSFSPSGKNLGRAGSLNNYVPQAIPKRKQ